MHLAFDRRADADLHHSPRLDQPLLNCVIEHRTMGVDLPEILRPGIDMGIEMDQRRRAVPLRQRAKERQRNAVIAAQRDEVLDSRAAWSSITPGCRRYRPSAIAKLPMSAKGSVRRIDPVQAGGRRRPASGSPAGLPPARSGSPAGWWCRGRRECRRRKPAHPHRCARSRGMSAERHRSRPRSSRNGIARGEKKYCARNHAGPLARSQRPWPTPRSIEYRR